MAPAYTPPLGGVRFNRTALPIDAIVHDSELPGLYERAIFTLFLS